jgi:flavodoxin
MTGSMKVLIVYDSLYGNTQQIAQAIGDTLGNQANITMLRVGDVRPEQFAGINSLIIGSPTQRFRPTPAISNLLKGIPKNGLKGVKVAAFDTRLTTREINETPILAFFVRVIGHSAYAAKPIADNLKKKGGELIVSPEGFFVEGMKGPLVQGELERAMNWAKLIRSKTQ